MIDISKLDFLKLSGLIPAVIQDAVTGDVLMLGFMNEEALKQSIKTNLVTFFSRTKNRIWCKGETSGDYLDIVSMHQDCDNDSLLILANPRGNTCHTGTKSCFFDESPVQLSEISQLYKIVKERASSDVYENESYTKRLLKEGVKRVAQKVGEEGVEVALAAVGGDEEELVNEMRDLLYHMFVLLESKNVDISKLCDAIKNKRIKG